jgi:hypothetical protein
MYIPKKIKQLYPYLREALTASDAAWRFSVWAILWFWLLTFFLVAWPLLIEKFSIWKLLGFLTFHSAIIILVAVAYLLIHLLTRLSKRFVFALILPLPLLLLLFVEFGQTAGIAIFVGGLLCLIVVSGTSAAVARME